MFDLKSLIGKLLVSVTLGHNHEKVHHAWRDESNEGFLICYDINLEFENNKIYSIKPCEVEMIHRYPSLGLSVEAIEKIELSFPFNIAELPMRICDIIESDHLGEEVTNQYTLVLDNGKNIVFSHVYPPMSMGIKIE
jgi:hypothetical protein